MALDLINLVIFGYGFYFGYSKNILQVLFLIVVVVVTLFGAMWFTPMVHDVLKANVGLKVPYLSLISFASTLLVSFLVVKLFSNAINESITGKRSQHVDNFGGGLLMGLACLFLWATLLRFAERSALISEKTKNNSYSFKYVSKMPDAGFRVVGNVAPFVREFYQYMKGLPDTAALKDLIINDEDVVPQNIQPLRDSAEIEFVEEDSLIKVKYRDPQ